MDIAQAIQKDLQHKDKFIHRSELLQRKAVETIALKLNIQVDFAEKWTLRKGDKVIVMIPRYKSYHIPATNERGKYESIGNFLHVNFSYA